MIVNALKNPSRYFAGLPKKEDGSSALPEGFKCHFKDHYILRTIEIINAQMIKDQDLQFAFNIKWASGIYTGYHKNFKPECVGVLRDSKKSVYIGEFKDS